MNISRTIRRRSAALCRSFLGLDHYGTIPAPRWLSAPLWALATVLALLAYPSVNSLRNGDPAGEVGR